jgi:aspartyl-tRNA(Asn)/glutamyl-tRNA(Gln) amidotransferase subunit B
MLDHPSSATPAQIAKDLSLIAQANDDGNALLVWCQEAIDALPEEAVVVRAGNFKVLNKLVGRVMKVSRGTADAQAVRAALEKMLRSS